MAGDARWGDTEIRKTKHVVLDDSDCKPYQVEPGRYARVSITDTGVGMDEKTLKHIYDPFFTTKEKSRGTGLGLASAYGIIKNHAGIIHAESKTDYGTTFNLYLPISEKLVEKECSSEKKIYNGSETILIVDDEDMIIEVGQALLKRLGYQVITAKSGEEALEVVHRKGAGVDLVILDMIMPGMDGGRTFDGIRETCPVDADHACQRLCDQWSGRKNESTGVQRFHPKALQHLRTVTKSTPNIGCDRGTSLLF